MGSEVRVRDLDTHEAIVFRVVFPRSADVIARRISILAPLGMAVLGRRAGDHVNGKRREGFAGCGWIGSSISRSARAGTSHDGSQREGGGHGQRASGDEGQGC